MVFVQTVFYHTIENVLSRLTLSYDLNQPALLILYPSIYTHLNALSFVKLLYLRPIFINSKKYETMCTK